MTSKAKLAATSLGIGAIAGLRSMTAPAVLNLVRKPSRRGRFSFLRSNRALTILAALAIGELVIDKLPGTPSRTALPGLIVRGVTGGVTGAELWAKNNKQLVAGALLGAAGAIAASFAAYEGRRRLGRRLGLPDPIVAIVEDAIAVGGGALLARSA